MLIPDFRDEAQSPSRGRGLYQQFFAHFPSKVHENMGRRGFPMYPHLSTYLPHPAGTSLISDTCEDVINFCLNVSQWPDVDIASFLIKLGENR